jgi:hypothetical protein
MDVEGKRITLKGTNSALVIGGHGITENVDKDHFDAWMKLHAESEMVKGKFIFSHDKAESVKAKAKDHAENKNGFEGLDPKAPAPGIKPAEKD